MLAHKIPCTQLTQASLLDLMRRDYLDFSLHHTIDNSPINLLLSNDHQVTLLADGIITFNVNNKSKRSKSIILSCGIHGNETAPIEICNQLISELLNETMSTPHRVMFIFGNLASMPLAERFIEENLNRLFSRTIQSNTAEGVRARQIMHYVDTFFECAGAGCERIHYDLHTAIRGSKNDKFAVYPFLHGKPYSKAQLAFLATCEVKTILLSQSPTTTFSYYSSNTHGAHAFTVELGKVMPFGQNDMTNFTAVHAMLKALINTEQVDVPNFEQCAIDIYTVNQVINKTFDDFTLHFADDTVNFETFAKGDLLASETNKRYFAEFDGEAIVFPNANVGKGQRALLTVIPYIL